MRISGAARPLVLLPFLILFSCSTFAPEPRTQPPAAVHPPAEKSAPVRTEDAVLRNLPSRIGDFLLELKKRLLAGDLEWAAARAEPGHYDRYVSRRGMDKISYLSLLMDVGGSYARGQNPLAPEPKSFDLGRLSAMTYMKARKEGFSYIVEGIMIDSRGVGVDFTLDVLGELQNIMLAGK